MVGTTGWKRCLGAVVVAVVMTVSGCGGLPFGNSPTPSLAPTYNPDRPVPAAPKGLAWAVADQNGVLVAVPKNWKVMSAETVLASGDRSLLTKFAKQFKLDPSQLDEMMRSFDVMSFAPPVKGFAPNINVGGQKGTVPTKAEITAQLKGTGMKPGKVRTAKTPMGTATVVPYSMSIAGRTVHGRAILVQKKDRLVTVAVSHVSAKEADKVTGVVLKHLRTY